MNHEHYLPSPPRRTFTFERVSRWSNLSVALYSAALTMAAATLVMPKPVAAADDNRIERLATCKDAWFEWKEGTPRMTEYIRYLQAGMTAQDDGQSMKPKTPTTLFGMPVVDVYPQSVGMGAGFSALVDADLAQVRRTFEKQTGRPMTCSTSDGTQSCELKIADRRTVTLMASVRPGKPTLAGCYYFYQQ